MDALKAIRLAKLREEHEVIKTALDDCGWKLLAAARALGVKDNTLRSALKARHSALYERLKKAIADRA